jgi:hypothetical protein
MAITTRATGSSRPEAPKRRVRRAVFAWRKWLKRKGTGDGWSDPDTAFLRREHIPPRKPATDEEQRRPAGTH